MQLTEHFSLAELVRSSMAINRGIDNTPPPELMPNIRALAEGLERVRAVLGHPIFVTSGYRCRALNQLVGGVQDSDHTKGLAADIQCQRFGTPLEICRAIADSGIEVDQLIHEFGRWCHVSFPAPGALPRHQHLTIAAAIHGYVPGLHPVETA